MAFDANGRWVLPQEAQSVIDNDVNFFDEVARGISSGLVDGTEETLQFGKTAIDGAIEFFGGEGFDDERKPIITFQPDRPRTVGGQIVGDVTRFGAGFVGAGKIKAVGAVGRGVDKLLLGKRFRSVRQGAVGDAIVSNPYETRLADIIEAHPELANPVSAYLASDEEDSFMEGKLKAGIEGGITGAAVEGVFAVVKAFKRSEKAIEEGADVDSIVKETDPEINKASEAEAVEIETQKAELEALRAEAIVEQRAKGTTNTPQSMLVETTEAATEEAPKLTASKELLRRKLSKALTQNDGNKDAVLRNVTKEELLRQAEMAGIKVTRANAKTKKRLFDTIVDDLYKGVELPKGSKEVNLKTKVADTGVQAPKPVRVKKLNAKEIKDIASNPKNLGDTLKKGNLYNPKTWDPTSPKQVKDVVAGLIKANSKAFQEVRGKQSFKDAEKGIEERFGDMFGLSNEEIAGIVTNFTKATEDATFVLGAAESVVKKQYEDLYDKIMDVRFNTDKGFTSEVLESLESSNILLKSLQGQETAFGRALNLRKQGVLDADQLGKQSFAAADDVVNEDGFQAVVKAYGGKEGLERLRADFAAAGRGNVKGINRAVKAVTETKSTKFKRSVVELFRSMILFNTKTHVTNMVSGGAETFLRPIEGYVGSYMNLKPFSAEHKAARDFYSAQIEGLFMSIDVSIAQAARAFNLERNLLDTVGKIDDITQANKITSEYWGEAKDTFLGSFLDYTGKASRMSLRALGAEDEFFKQVNYRSQVYAKAKLDGVGKGLEGDDLIDYVTKELDGAFDESGAAATVNGKFKYTMALDTARRVTFTQELRKGSMAKGLHDFVSQYPTMQLIMPFVRTPTNLILTAVQRTPLLSMLSKDLQGQLKSTDPIIRSQAQGKFGTGLMIYGGAMSLVMSNKVTGAGPVDPEQQRAWRAAGNQPYSIRVGDKWVSYQRLDPNFMPVAMVANLWDAIRYSPSYGGPTQFTTVSEFKNDVANVDIPQAALATILGITKTLEDKAYFQGAASMIAALTSENPAQASSMQRMLENYAGSFVPAAPQQIAEGLKFLVDGQPEEVKEAVGLIDNIRRRWVTTNKDLPTKYNWLTGKPMLNEGGFSGIPVVDDKSNRVVDELVRLKVGFRGPTKTFGNLKFKLNTEEFAAYQKYTGTLRLEGKTLMQNLDSLFQSDLYKRAATDFELTSEGFNKQADLARKIVSKHLKAARDQLLIDFPDLTKEVVARKVARQTGYQITDFNR